MATNKFVKDPSALLDYRINWARWLGTDTISSSAWAIDGDDLLSVEDSYTDTAATIWLSGGTLGTKYTVTNHIATDGGRIDERSIYITIKEQ